LAKERVVTKRGEKGKGDAFSTPARRIRAFCSENAESIGIYR